MTSFTSALFFATEPRMIFASDHLAIDVANNTLTTALLDFSPHGAVILHLRERMVRSTGRLFVVSVPVCICVDSKPVCSCCELLLVVFEHLPRVFWCNALYGYGTIS